MQERHRAQPHSTVDGLRIEFGKEWVHLRKSNTEPIVRIYAESDSMAKADELARRIMAEMNELAKAGVEGR
jgi:phosphomannomutase